MKRLSYEEIRNLCLSLGTLIHAGISTGDGLSLLAEDEEPSEYRDLLLQLAEKADCGFSMSAAMKESGAFPGYVCGLLEVGERSGEVEESLFALAKYYEERVHMEKQIKSALLYPAVLLFIMLAVIVVLLAKVLPVFDSVYAQLGNELTGIAGGLLVFGQVLDHMMPVLCGILVIAVVFLGCFAVSTSFRSKILGFWNRKRGHKGVSGKLNHARVAQVLAMGMKSGLPVEDALDLAAELASDVPVIHDKCYKCAGELANGMPLTETLRKHEILPQTECRLLEAGQKGGAGDTAMQEIARRMQNDSEDALYRTVGMVEPALVLVTSVLIGLILLSVMLPLVDIMSAIG